MAAETVIRHGERVIWREPAFFGYPERFEDVAVILQEKYGPHLKDVIPTWRAGDSLYGDRLVNPRVVVNARLRLFGDQVGQHRWHVDAEDGRTVVSAL